MASATIKPTTRLKSFVRVEIDPSRGRPSQPMVSLSLKEGLSAVYMGYAMVDELIADLIRARDVAEDLFRKQYPQQPE